MHRFDWRLRVAMLTLAAGALTLGSLGAASAEGAINSSTGSTAAEASVCKQQGALRYGIGGGGINNLDPAVSNLANRIVVMPLLYPALTKLDQYGRVSPDLATRWRHSADMKTWWFYLKRNVRYSNGRAFTADDVVANVLRNLNPTVGSAARRFIQDIQSVRAITKYQVRFRLGSPTTILPDALFLVKMSDTTNPEALATGGAGPGPYRVASYVPNNSLTLVPNRFYFGPKPCLRSISILAQPDSTSMVTAFRSRKLDMIWQVPTTAISAIQATRDAVIINPRTVATAHVLAVDTTSPPWDKPAARLALSYAMNRTAMVRAAFLGRAQASVANSPISTTSPAYNKKLKPHTFNLARARQLFTQAGVQPGTTFTYWAQAGRRPEWITNGQILQQDLRKIGINLEIEQSDPATWLARFNPSPKKYPGLIVATFLSLQPTPALGLSSALRGCDCNWGLAPGTPYPKYYSLVLKSLGTADQAKRQGMYNELQQMFSQQSPYLVIAHQTNIVAAHRSVVGAWVDPSGNVHLENARLAP